MYENAGFDGRPQKLTDDSNDDLCGDSFLIKFEMSLVPNDISSPDIRRSGISRVCLPFQVLSDQVSICEYLMPGV